jgi:hypothetical protein
LVGFLEPAVYKRVSEARLISAEIEEVEQFLEKCYGSRRDSYHYEHEFDGVVQEADESPNDCKLRLETIGRKAGLSEDELQRKLPWKLMRALRNDQDRERICHRVRAGKLNTGDDIIEWLESRYQEAEENKRMKRMIHGADPRESAMLVHGLGFPPSSPIKMPPLKPVTPEIPKKQEQGIAPDEQLGIQETLMSMAKLITKATEIMTAHCATTSKSEQLSKRRIQTADMLRVRRHEAPKE